MKKELTLHLLFAFALINFVAVAKGWLDWSFGWLWLGAVMGTLLPDLDHLVYVYFLRPQELVSQRYHYFINNKQYVKALEILLDNKYQRTKQIFHTAQFQLIFVVLTFLIITSSGNYFGIGLVLAFYMHLLVDQLVDFFEIDSLDSWFRELPIALEREKYVLYWVALLLVLLFFAFFL